VARGDLSGAERLLREAAAIQEVTLGSDHPDLASTLNNLAFVCEHTHNIADAERNYRRAHSIAVASLGPRHPFVATSVKNLVDFCAAHDIPIWKPPAETSDPDASVSPHVAATSDADISELDVAEAEAAADWDVDTLPEPVPAAGSIHARSIGVAALALVIIVGVAFTTMRWRGASPPREAPRSSSTTPVAASEAAPPAAVDAAPAVAPAPVDRAEPREKSERAAPHDTRGTPQQAVTVLNARLCDRLVKQGSPDWQCSSSTSVLRPGTYSFYTRLLTSASTTVEHRWYRDGRVHQVMRLRITPNPSGGYRTYSSNTISSERAGNWTVELRGADGTLLHEERFVVR
jgi:DUF2914 family protein/tetratricopeptide repeat protein